MTYPTPRTLTELISAVNIVSGDLKRVRAWADDQGGRAASRLITEAHEYAGTENAGLAGDLAGDALGAVGDQATAALAKLNEVLVMVKVAAQAVAEAGAKQAARQADAARLRG